MSAWEEIKQIYRKTNKPKDFLFNQWVCRPPAAALVYLLKNRRITPNQVTFLSLAMALCANAMLLFVRSYVGLIGATLFLQLAFILDCTDGQLARIRGTSSAVGGLLDFLMDEIKAITLIASISGRLAWQSSTMGGATLSPITWLGLGMAGVVVVAIGISLTTFMRRSEYTDSLQMEQHPSMQRVSLLNRLISMAEWLGRSVINYPSWFFLPALLGKIEWFFIPYLTAHLLYLGRASLSVLLHLGRCAPLEIPQNTQEESTPSEVSIG